MLHWELDEHDDSSLIDLANVYLSTAKFMQERGEIGRRDIYYARALKAIVACTTRYAFEDDYYSPTQGDDSK